MPSPSLISLTAATAGGQLHQSQPGEQTGHITGLRGGPEDVRSHSLIHYHMTPPTLHTTSLCTLIHAVCLH